MDLNEVSYRLPQRPSITDEEKQRIQMWDYTDIDFEQMNSDSPIQLKVITPLEEKIERAIVLDVQVINNNIYQLHIALHDELQHLGLGYKIYKRFIDLFGNVYSGKGRQHNDAEIPRIYDKLSKEPNIECKDMGYGTLCMLKS